MGFILHGLVPVVMGPYAGLIVFSLATLSVYVLFVDERKASRLVIWDDRCSVCERWVTLFNRLDWLPILRFEGASRPLAPAEAGVTADRAREEILLWDGRRVYGGFDAVREILKMLPVGKLALVQAFRRFAGLGFGPIEPPPAGVHEPWLIRDARPVRPGAPVGARPHRRATNTAARHPR